MKRNAGRREYISDSNCSGLWANPTAKLEELHLGIVGE